MKWASRNKTAEKRLKMTIFKRLVLSYMHTTLKYFFLLFDQYNQVLCCLSLNLQIWVWYISKY